MKTRARTMHGLQIIASTTVILAIMTLVYSFWDAPPIAQGVPVLSEDTYAKVIGLISDTHAHLPILSKEIPESVFEVFKEANVSLIIHAGDVTNLNIIKKLERIAPVVAVYGNVDPPKMRTILPTMSITEINGLRIGVIHNVGFPPFWGMNEMERIAKEKDLNVLVFGHTHKPFLRVKEGVIFINPGSPIDPLPPFLVKRTIGLLVITEEGIEPFIIEV